MSRAIPLFAIGLSIALSGCISTQGLLPQTLGEKSTNYGYVPLDGLPVSSRPGDSCPTDQESGTYKPLLESLPDISARFAVGKIDSNGVVTFGPSKLTVKQSSYKAVLDYVNVDTVSANMWIRKNVRGPDGKIEPAFIADDVPLESVVSYDVNSDFSYYNDDDKFLRIAEELVVTRDVKSGGDELTIKRYQTMRDEKYTLVTVPIYVGIGLRLTADIVANEGNIALNGLSQIGAQAESKALSGTLTVQTIGVSGKQIGTSLPLPNKLDSTTVENAILAVGNSRATLYTQGNAASTADAISTPRVVGLYSPYGADPKLINRIYSYLSANRPIWKRPCTGSSPTSRTAP